MSFVQLNHQPNVLPSPGYCFEHIRRLEAAEAREPVKAGCVGLHTHTTSQGQRLTERPAASQGKRTGPDRSDANTSCLGPEDLSPVAQQDTFVSRRNAEGSIEQLLCLDFSSSIFLIALRRV